MGVSGLLVDTSPLRESRDYRLLYSGEFVSWLGRQMTVLAVMYQVYRLTGSSFAVGMVGLAQLGPLVACSFVGGAVADAVDRRRLLLVTQVALALSSAGLALNAGARHPAVWPLYVLSGLAAGVSGIDSPTVTATVPRLVRRDQLAATAALSQIQYTLPAAIGPAVAGVLIDRIGLADVYWIDVATFAVMFVTVWLMHPLPPEDGGTRVGLASVREGLRYLRGKPVLIGTFVADLDAMVFGMPRALFPALGTTVFHGGATTVGLLGGAPFVGALLAAVLTGWVGRVRRQGLAVIAAIVAWGAAITLFGVVSWLPVALLLLAVAGGADIVSAVFRNTILQVTAPDSLRGRLSAIHIAVVTGGPRLGDAEAGTVAAVSTPRISVVSGGLACVAGVLVMARFLPGLARYDAGHEEAVAPVVL